MMKHHLRLVALLMATVFVGGCAKSAHELAADYVSPLDYQGYSCKNLRSELGRVSSQVNQLAQSVDSSASSDKVKMAVGLVLFWPTLFFLDGDSAQAHKYSRLKGQYTAIQQAMRKRHCRF